MAKSTVAGRMLDSEARAALAKADGSVQASSTGQEMTGSVGHAPYDYGKLSNGDIVIDPENGHFGVVERDNSSNAIKPVAGPYTNLTYVEVEITGTSDSGTPTLEDWDGVDGAELPNNGETVILTARFSPAGAFAFLKLLPS